MATGPPDEVPPAHEPATAMPADANEPVVMAASRPCLIMLETNMDDPDEIPPSSSSCIAVTHFPFDVDEDGNITFLKDGVWYQAGKCPECGDIGPARVDCVRCARRELKYDPFVISDETVAGPGMEVEPSVEVPAAPYTQVPSTPEPVTSGLTNTAERVFRADRRSGLIMRARDGDDLVVGPGMEVDRRPCACPGPIVADHLPVQVNLEGNVDIWKDGMWHPAGECVNCGQLGPGYYPCTYCAPMKFLYVIADHEPDGVDLDPRKLGIVAHLVHSTLRDEPDTQAARRHFMLLLNSLFTTDELGPFD